MRLYMNTAVDPVIFVRIRESRENFYISATEGKPEIRSNLNMRKLPDLQ